MLNHEKNITLFLTFEEWSWQYSLPIAFETNAEFYCHSLNSAFNNDVGSGNIL